jgi:hypothetical protein
MFVFVVHDAIAASSSQGERRRGYALPAGIEVCFCASCFFGLRQELLRGAAGLRIPASAVGEHPAERRDLQDAEEQRPAAAGEDGRVELEQDLEAVRSDCSDRLL